MKNKAPARLRKKHYFGRGAMFVLCAIFAVLFLLPTVLTITSSFSPKRRSSPTMA